MEPRGLSSQKRGAFSFNKLEQVAKAVNPELELSAEVARIIGFVIGVVVLVAFVRAIFKWDRKGNRPQAITLYTKDTPYDILGKDLAGLAKLVLIAIGVGIVLAVLIARATPLP